MEEALFTTISVNLPMMVSGATIPSTEKENYTVNSLRGSIPPLISQISIKLKIIGWYMKDNSTKIAKKDEGNFSLAMGNTLRVFFHLIALMENALFIVKMDAFSMEFGDRINYKD